MKIVIVDDNKNVRDILTSLLPPLGHQVSTARDGEEAIAKIHETHPDLVLLDIMMPKMDGATVAQLLADSPETKSIPIVFLTGLVDAEEVRNRGHRFGGRYYLAKPFDLDGLKKVIAMATAEDL